MLSILANRTYRHLFAAQVIALIGTGLLTVALGLLAYNLAGARADAVVGTALAIKMVAYVLVAPVASAFTGQLPRRAFLVATDVVGAGVALLLPFVTEAWQVYILVFVLQSCSADFMPTLQATIPDILPDEDEYTRALSLSRLVYDLENLLSPTFAALLLALISFHWLFAGTAVGSCAPQLWWCRCRCRPRNARRAAAGSTIVPLAVCASISRLRVCAHCWRSTSRRRPPARWSSSTPSSSCRRCSDVRRTMSRSHLAALAAGPWRLALLLPRVLDRLADRTVMLVSAGALGALLLGFAVAAVLGGLTWPVLLALWLLLRIGYSAAQTPSGRLLRRSAAPDDRPALFAAQFALSHVASLLTYPLAGWLGAKAGMPATLAVLGAMIFVATAAGVLLRPAADPHVVEHTQDDLDTGHVHLSGVRSRRHAHTFVIDDLHDRWPARQG